MIRHSFSPSLQDRFIPFLIAILFAFSIIGCSPEAEYTPIDFSEKIKVEQPSGNESKEKILRVAVAAMISPKETLSYYRELLDYIGNRLGYRVELIQRKTYGEINELFPKRQIDLAFICTGPYAAGKEIYGFEAIATPVVRGNPFYQSYMIVNKSSSYQSLDDLRGGMFAFTDPDSNTGSLVPTYWLHSMGETASTFFRDTTYTFSHDNSILAVAKNLVDAAAVDGHKWEYYNQRNPYYTSMTRVIKKSEPLGSPPLVTSVYLSEKLKKKIQQLIISMHKEEHGAIILNGLMIDRFDIPKEAWYEPVRTMYRQVHADRGSNHASEES